MSPREGVSHKVIQFSLSYHKIMNVKHVKECRAQEFRVRGKSEEGEN